MSQILHFLRKKKSFRTWHKVSAAMSGMQLKEEWHVGATIHMYIFNYLETYITLHLNKSRSIHSPGLHPLALTPAVPQQAMGPSCKADLRTDEHWMNLSLFCWIISQTNHFLNPQPSPYFPSCHCCSCILWKKEKSHQPVDKGCEELLCFSDLKPWTLLLPWAVLSCWGMLPGQALSLQSNTTIRSLVLLREYRAGHHSYKLLEIWYYWFLERK